MVVVDYNSHNGKNFFLITIVLKSIDETTLNHFNVPDFLHHPNGRQFY